MKCNLKLLLIGITLYFLFGNIISHAFLTPEAGESYFITWTEATYFHSTPKLEEDTFSESSIPSTPNVACTFRHTFKNKRINPPSSYTNGFISLKGKEQKNYYILHPFTFFCRRFSSGLNEAKQNLISFGRLII